MFIELFIHLFGILNKYIFYYLIDYIIYDKKSNNLYFIFSFYSILFFVDSLTSNLLTSIKDYNSVLTYIDSQQKITNKLECLKYEYSSKLNPIRISAFSYESMWLIDVFSKIITIPLYVLEIIIVLLYYLYKNEYYLCMSLFIFVLLDAWSICLNISDKNIIEITNKRNKLNNYNVETYENIKYLKTKNLINKERNTYRFQENKNIITNLNSKIFFKSFKNKILKTIASFILNYLFILKKDKYFFYQTLFHHIFNITEKYDQLPELITYLSYGIKYSLFINLDDSYCENNENNENNENIEINHIKFNNITKYYDDIKCFEDVNFEINKNEIIAICGKSGVGKTTLIDVLLGLTEYKGQILINHIDSKKYNIKSIRKSIGVISQKPEFFNISLRENLLMETNKKYSDEQLIKFLKDIDLDIDINDLNENIGVQGSKYSGGQKQRIGIIRTLLSDCNVILFDEPTSALDDYTEKKTIDVILKLGFEKTLIFITHKPAILKHVDKIITLENQKNKID